MVTVPCQSAEVPHPQILPIDGSGRLEDNREQARRIEPDALVYRATMIRDVV